MAGVPEKKRPRRFQLKHNNPIESDIIMAFHYNAVSKVGGKVATRISLQGSVSTQEVVTDAVAECGLTEAQINTAGPAIFRAIIRKAGKQGKNALRIFDLLSFRPTCGGEFPDLNFQPTAEAMNLSLRGSLAPAGQSLMEEGLEFIRDESIGEKQATIERVYNATSKATDRYTAGGGFKINGQDLGRPDLQSSQFGLFLEAVTGGARTRCSSIIDWTEGEITGAWPAGVTGAQRLVVTQYDFGSPRTSIYGTTLTA